MSSDDIFFSIVCVILLGAWVEAMGGRRIHRGWSRVYDSLADAMRSTPPHLRGREPVECGVGRETDYRVAGGRVRPEAIRCAWDAEAKQLSRVPLEPLALMASRTIPGYDASTQTVNGVPLEALLANRLPSVREQAGLANAREFQRRYWESQAQAPRPTPAENARRYAAEGGTW